MSEEKKFDIINMSDIYADATFNSRGPIKPLDVVDLANDIKRHGLLQPVVVQRSPEGHISGKKYLLRAGFRRHMAHIVNESPTIEAVIKENLTEGQARILNIAENMQRQNLNILQEARAIEPLFNLGYTEQMVMDELKTSRGWVQVRGMLLKLPQDIQQEAAMGLLTQTQIRAIYTHYIRTQKSDGTKSAIKAIYAQVREMKDAKLKGRGAITRTRAEKKQNKKRHRTRQEIFQKQEFIQNQIGNSLATRAMAWCAGEISDLEYDETLKLFASKIGKKYNPEVESH
jgi:ParB/RepB/Spo0J family partition protein